MMLVIILEVKKIIKSTLSAKIFVAVSPHGEGIDDLQFNESVIWGGISTGDNFVSARLQHAHHFR